MQVNTAFPRFEKLEPTVRQRILDAAAKEFGRFGYGAASMNRLVKGAGISKGAIFNYFGTKAGLFDYIYRSSLEEVKVQLRTVRDSSRTEPFFGRLEKVLRTGLDFTTRRPLSAAIYYRVIYTGDAPHGNRILSQIQETSKRFLKNLIEDGVRKGELRPDIDAEKSAFIIQSVLDRFLQAHYLEFMAPALNHLTNKKGPDPSSTSEKWILEIMDIFRCGLVNSIRRDER
ncbi:MAG: TetR/AcrR family transcriptional regulator [bacterium]|nr:TetR/AcrR family transcriptional regulator [bacterium]MDT8366790.1 TetR/AcrR family transcriptional regulator [bacterium]